MFPAKPMLAAVLAIGVGYAAYPYVTLYRLDNAIHTGDAATLRALVDWPAVREGIKEDICDNVADDPQSETASCRRSVPRSCAASRPMRWTSGSPQRGWST